MISLLIGIGLVGLIIIGWFALRARQDNKNAELNNEISRLNNNSIRTIEVYIEFISTLNKQKKSIEFLTEELKRMDNQISNIEKFNDELEEYNDLFGDAVEQDIEDLRKSFSSLNKDNSTSKRNIEKLYRNFDLNKLYLDEFKEHHNLLCEKVDYLKESIKKIKK